MARLASLLLASVCALCSLSASAAPKTGEPPATTDGPPPKSPAPSPAPPPDGGGSGAAVKPQPPTAFTFSGADEAGKAVYSGTGTLKKVGGGIYTGTWKVGTTSQSAAAFFDDKTLAVGWAPKAKDAHVVAYLVTGNKLEGVLSDGGPRVGQETLEPVGATKDLVGRYKITKATNPDGSSYEGSVTIKKLASPAFAYHVVWVVGGNTITGVAVRRGTYLVVGYADGGTSFGAGVYELGAGGGLDGQWVRSVDGKITGGTETAKP